MQKLVLVGIDPGYKDISALQWAIELATATDQELLVVSGFKIGQAEVSPEFHDELLEQAHTQIDKKLDTVDRSGRARTRSIIKEGDPAQVVVDLVHAEDPSIVVLGSKGEGGYDQLAVGGTGHRVLHELTRPVAVVRHHGGLIEGGNVVVVADESASTTATDWAESIAELVGAQKRFVDPSSAADDVVVRSACAIGDELDAAMIIVGTRGAGSILDLAEGRIAARLIEESDRPVVLIHEPW